MDRKKNRALGRAEEEMKGKKEKEKKEDKHNHSN